MDSPESQFYHPVFSRLMTGNFRFLSDLSGLLDKEKVQKKVVDLSKEEWSQVILELSFLYGAKLVGITDTSTSFCYSHRGRRDDNYGEEVSLDHPYTIVFAVEMVRELVSQAPKIKETMAVTKGYIDAAVIGMVLTYMPLEKTKKGGFEVKDFCQVCQRCARFCPSKAIPQGKMEEIPLSISQDQCYTKWREFGTDCGLCISVCPFSLPLDQDKLSAYHQDHRAAMKIVQEFQKTFP